MPANFLSLIIPCCNPDVRHLEVVLDALRNQTLPKDQWELIVIDDASKKELAVGSGQLAGEELVREEGGQVFVDLSWHPNARLMQTDREREGIGLVSSRLYGFELGKGDVFVFVDQDNALRADYLEEVIKISRDFPHLGTWGGQILLKFDEPDKAPEKWLQGGLCTRELERDIWTNITNHHDSTPWGAGLCARRDVLNAYRKDVLKNPMRRLLDPTPRRAGYGGDSDLSYAGIRGGYGKGVFKRLVMDHLIPVGRCSDEYLLRNAEANGYSTVLHGFVETGKVKPPRNDWRYWTMSLLRRPKKRRLEWEMEIVRRRGMRKAVEELSVRREEFSLYAAALDAKSRLLKR